VRTLFFPPPEVRPLFHGSNYPERLSVVSLQFDSLTATATVDFFFFFRLLDPPPFIFNFFPRFRAAQRIFLKSAFTLFPPPYTSQGTVLPRSCWLKFPRRRYSLFYFPPPFFYPSVFVRAAALAPTVSRFDFSEGRSLACSKSLSLALIYPYFRGSFSPYGYGVFFAARVNTLCFPPEFFNDH